MQIEHTASLLPTTLNLVGDVILRRNGFYLLWSFLPSPKHSRIVHRFGVASHTN